MQQRLPTFFAAVSVWSLRQHFQCLGEWRVPDCTGRFLGRIGATGAVLFRTRRGRGAQPRL